MTKFLKSRVKKIGLPPGSLISVTDEKKTPIQISVFDYDKDNIIEKPNATVEECLILLDSPSMTWINVVGISDAKFIETIGHHFGLHPLMLEDILTTGQRSKLDHYPNSVFIVTKMLNCNQEKFEVSEEQVSLVLGKNYLISFLETSHDIFNPVRERIRNSQSRIRQLGADYLCYALLDCIVDNYFIILEKVDENLVSLEEELVDHPTKETLHKMQATKREVILLRKAVWPMREVISQFQRLETPVVSQTTQVYMHDVYDHTIQAIDTIESFRDISSGMLDVYLSNISQRLNEVMKVLTVVSTIFVPLTFIASLYGMNLEHIPEIHWKYSYPVVLGVMLLIVLGMLYFFRKKEWI